MEGQGKGMLTRALMGFFAGGSGQSHLPSRRRLRKTPRARRVASRHATRKKYHPASKRRRRMVAASRKLNRGQRRSQRRPGR